MIARLLNATDRPLFKAFGNIQVIQSSFEQQSEAKKEERRQRWDVGRVLGPSCCGGVGAPNGTKSIQATWRNSLVSLWLRFLLPQKILNSTAMILW